MPVLLLLFLAGSAKNASALKQDATKGVGRVGE